MNNSQFVYVLVSTVDPDRHYVRLTSNVSQRLDVHNSGGSRHTAPYRPWRLIVALAFATGASAVRRSGV
jgi:putative endonuclease